MRNKNIFTRFAIYLSSNEQSIFICTGSRFSYVFFSFFPFSRTKGDIGSIYRYSAISIRGVDRFRHFRSEDDTRLAASRLALLLASRRRAKRKTKPLIGNVRRNVAADTYSSAFVRLLFSYRFSASGTPFLRIVLATSAAGLRVRSRTAVFFFSLFSLFFFFFPFSLPRNDRTRRKSIDPTRQRTLEADNSSSRFFAISAIYISPFLDFAQQKEKILSFRGSPFFCLSVPSFQVRFVFAKRLERVGGEGRQ